MVNPHTDSDHLAPTPPPPLRFPGRTGLQKTPPGETSPPHPATLLAPRKPDPNRPKRWPGTLSVSLPAPPNHPRGRPVRKDRPLKIKTDEISSVIKQEIAQFTDFLRS